jgi:NAD(P) transhydrogenase subunit alpha
MRIGVPKETADGERRVAMVPETVAKLTEDGEFEVLVEAGAGREYRPDEAYEEAGAKIAEDADAVYSDADVVVKVRPPDESEVERLGEGTVLISFMDPNADEELVKKLADKGVTTLSMAVMPRTGQAQSMDAISSMSSIAGYASVLEAASAAGRYLPMMTTAAGTTKAARVMVLGVGVAGLQAIATARRLGAEVEAFDIREEVKDQVKSLGATFIDSEDDGDEAADEDASEVPEPGRVEAFAKDLLGLRRDFGRSAPDEEDDGAGGGDADAASGDGDDEDGGSDSDKDGYAGEQSEEKQKRDQELVAERISEMDVVITTALVPGKDAPTLVTKEMVERMKPGAVLLDMAVEAGGNCELSEPGKTVEHGNVRILGPLNIPSSMPIHASELYSKNVESLLSHLVDDDGAIQWDFDDEITNAVCLTHDGEVRDTSPKESEDGDDSSDEGEDDE